jgi:hypothetical protein
VPEEAILLSGLLHSLAVAGARPCLIPALEPPPQVSSHCPAAADRRQLRDTTDMDPADVVSSVHFWRRAATVGVLSLAAALALAATLLAVMLRNSRALVDWAFAANFCVMLASAAVMLNVSAGVSFGYTLLALLWVWLYYLWCVSSPLRRASAPCLADTYTPGGPSAAAHRHHPPLVRHPVVCSCVRLRDVSPVRLLTANSPSSVTTEHSGYGGSKRYPEHAGARRRDKLELVAKMFSVSAAGLRANKHVLTTTLLLNLALCVNLAAVAAAVALAAANGQLQRAQNVTAAHGDRCVDGAGAAAGCCVWQPASWVPAYAGELSWVMLRARWVTLRARWVTLRARWVTLRARWVTLRARWVTLTPGGVTLTQHLRRRARCGPSCSRSRCASSSSAAPSLSGTSPRSAPPPRAPRSRRSATPRRPRSARCASAAWCASPLPPTTFLTLSSMVRRWLLIGYFPILYNPPTTPVQLSHADIRLIQHFDFSASSRFGPRWL